MKPQLDVVLKPFTNYKIGGRVRYFYEAGSVQDISDALDMSDKEKAPFFVLGAGTNILFSDEGFPGVVIKPIFNSIRLDSEDITVGAGLLISDLLNLTAEDGLSGLEWAGGLPGTLGGAIRGNAGAFRGEIKDLITNVVSFDTRIRKVVERDNRSCNFSYRSSVFKTKGDEIILSATFHLNRGGKQEITASIQEKIDFRLSRHPLEFPSAGSVFKNVDVRTAPKELLEVPGIVIKNDPFPVIPAAYLVDKAGLMGTRAGGAMVSKKHANFIINFDNATSNDVRKLIEEVKKEVKTRFGVFLEEEIMLL